MDAIVIVFGGTLVLLIIVMIGAAKLWPGSGADLLDWDPSQRIEARMTSEYEDAEQMLAMHNRRRRERGLPEHTEDEYREAVARAARERP